MMSSSVRQATPHGGSNSNTSSSSSSRDVCNCYFSHARGNTTSPDDDPPVNNTAATASQSTSNICKYFLQGRCIFGDNCYNRHVLVDDSSNVVVEQSDGASPSQDDDDGSAATTAVVVDDNDDDEINYESAAAAVVSSSPSLSSSSSSSSTSTTPESNASLDVIKNNDNSKSELVKRSLGPNKPKLRLSTTTSSSSKSNTKLSVAAKPFEPKKQSTTTTPSSYYEALTGRPLNYADIDPDSSDLNIFDPAYAEYLRKTKSSIAAASAASQQLCPYSELHLECPFGEACDFARHLTACDQCGQHVLDDASVEQQQSHRAECMRRIEADMEEAFAVAASREKLCGICMEIVWEKEPASERRFGILQSCNHIFCLACIRKWRSSKSYENKVVKACPECRVKSDYVTPSRFWFDTDDAKKKIIDEYKTRLSKTHCKYFKQGDGTCPFGSKCFYLHQYKDGRLATNLPEPTRRRRFNRDGRLEQFHNLVQIEFSLSDDDDEIDSDVDSDDLEAEFDLFRFIRHSFLWGDHNDTDESDWDSDFLDEVLRST